MPARPRPITTDLLVEAYAMGIFPMAEHRHGPVRWLCPDPRGLMPLEKDRFHVPRSLRRRLRGGGWRITHDTAFERVMRACAEPRQDDDETWISEEIVRAYVGLHHAGLAHSVEAWAADGDEAGPRLVGGVYGVSLGGAFFAESMFSRATDASKVCLVHLVEHLRSRGFVLLDVQFVTPHLARFGAYELPLDAYLGRLREAMALPGRW
ncbi:MAG: leucyl/phenylalanyl-tRNA--protein transferase [Phycisphaeraceae bacterium]